MEELAYRDGLTGLFNRHAFDDRLIAMSGPTAVASAILMIDVDRFKSINDEHGHAIGDSTLTAVAGAILESVRPGDFVARFGGDEFVVLLPDTTEQIAVVVAERIRATVESVAGGPATTVSIGAASFASSARLTMRSADRALYEAKELGRNRVRP
jgi:diguanylate cyclase (GGDEF)-like protein